MRRLLALCLCPALVGCEMPMGIGAPDGAQRFEPPAVYREWWAMTEECSGRRGRFADVAWYRVPDRRAIDGYEGMWYAVGNRIVLAGAAMGWGDVVRHEMLHAIIGAPGMTTHPRDAFITRCGGVVACVGECIQDGGATPAPPSGAVHVKPSAIEVAVAVSPPAPSSEVMDGYFTMTITARNPATVPVIVDLPPPGDAGPSVSFSYKLVCPGLDSWYDMRADVPDVTWFAPGETKRFLFDFHDTPGPTRYEVPPGTCQFRGAYGDVWAPDPPTVTVGP